MPEGPSILLVKEAAAKFAGKKIIAVEGNSKIDQSRLLNQKILEFKSWGKHFLICFDGRLSAMLFYTIISLPEWATLSRMKSFIGFGCIPNPI